MKALVILMSLSLLMSGCWFSDSDNETETSEASPMDSMQNETDDSEMGTETQETDQEQAPEEATPEPEESGETMDSEPEGATDADPE